MGGFSVLKGVAAGLTQAAGNDTLANNQQLEHKRRLAMTDEFRSSEIGRLNDAISSIQNNPMLSEDEKSGKIQAARSQILGMYTPALGKKRVAQLQQQYGLTPAAPQQGTVPAQPSTQFTAPPLQGESLGIPVDNGQGGTEGVPLGAPGGTFPTIDLPGKQAQPIANTPATVSDTLAAGHKQQYIPVTLANGTTMMLPQNLAGHLIATQESNAGKRGIAELKANSTEDIAGQNRDSRESIANQNRDSRESMASDKATKPQNRDDRYIAITSKPAAQWTPEEAAYVKGYKQLIQTKTTDPRVAGYHELNMGRPKDVVNPDNPNEVIPVRVGDAIKNHMATPASISFQVNKALDKYMIAGKGGESLNYFNTAISHLDQLGSVAGALNNGETQLFNKLGQSWAQQTGSSAPTNFDDVRAAVIGEIAKTFEGKAATKGEIDALTAGLNRAQSPDQLVDGIAQFTKLMKSKRDAIKQQYVQGRAGQPNFGDNTTPPAAPVTPGGLKAKANATAGGGPAGAKHVRIEGKEYWMNQQGIAAAKADGHQVEVLIK